MSNYSVDRHLSDGLNSSCKTCSSLAGKQQYISNNRARNLLHKYGITLEDYNQMFADQEGCCKVCDRHQSEFTNNLCVDHCHTTGKVRGLLCFSCNTGIGHLKDDIELLKRAITYLGDK